MKWHILAKYFFLYPAHLAASEGHLPCLKFIVCAGASIDHTLNARNDQVNKLYTNEILSLLSFFPCFWCWCFSFVLSSLAQGDTPKNLCQQFYKKDCIDYLNAVGESVCSPRSGFKLYNCPPLHFWSKHLYYFFFIFQNTTCYTLKMRKVSWSLTKTISL